MHQSKKTHKNLKDSSVRKNEISEFALAFSEETILYDGLEDAFIGVSFRFGQEPIACYDYDKVIEGLTKDGMSEEEAVEYFDYNIIGGWVGDYTPCFIKLHEEREDG